MARYMKREPFVSDPQLYMDYYTKQGSVGYVPFEGLCNQFGSLRSQAIPLGKPKNNTDLEKLQSAATFAATKPAVKSNLPQPVLISPAQAAADQAKAQIKRQRLLEKEITAPKKRKFQKKTIRKRKSTPKKIAETKKRKRKERI